MSKSDDPEEKSEVRPPLPSEYYRQQHPDLFSDSTEDDSHPLGEDEFKFHLDQITTERREREFEEFARAIAEKEICPNLLPQTGPVGGGDSKTDSSTYPVAQELAERRYWASNGRPANDDWAFAFSAKRAWQEKMKSDVGKIVGTSRHFSKVFFVTNQPVSDKIREKWETTMRQKYGRDIRILDRTWLVERVFKGHHVELAIAKLGLDVRITKFRRVGPRDAAREVQFAELLEALRNPDLNRVDDYSLAEDYLEAAKLASELGRPRTEVDALFLQARSLAKKSGNVGLVLRTLYHHAWRTYFWFDDSKQTEEIYVEMEPLLEQIGTGEECELFSNICTLLHTARVFGYLQSEPEKETLRLQRLKTRLTNLAKDTARPNTALYAKTLLVGWRMKENLGNKELLSEVLGDYLQCFRESSGLGTYPLLRFIEVVEGIGELFCTLPNYESFQSEVQGLVSERCGNKETGLRQLKYGTQLLKSGKKREALVQLSKARFNLAQKETLIESGRASLALGAAYMYLDHQWAARICFLTAAHLALYSVATLRENPGRGFVCVCRLAWVELQLGRLAPFLAWRNFSHGILEQMEAAGQDITLASEELERQDGCLGCFFIKLAKEDATEYRDLVVTLETMGLLAATIGLLYALGEIRTLEQKLSLNASELEQLIQSWRKEPAYSQLRAIPPGETRTTCVFETTLLGVRFRIRCKNALGPVLYAESILGMLESVFADAKWENFAFVVETVELWVTVDESGRNPPAFDPENFGMEEQALIWRQGMIEWMRGNPRQYGEHLHDFLTKLLLYTTVDALEDIHSEMDSWSANGVFQRLSAAESHFLALIDLIGSDKYDLNYWINASPSS